MNDYSKFQDFDKHREIIEINDAASGLYGYIAIHRSINNRAIGGTRIMLYSSKDEALRDVLRLSRAMTYKCAIAKLPFGGAKAVIIADPKNKTEKMLKKYAETVQNMQTSFFTGEDVGLVQPDVDYMIQFSDFFVGGKNAAGDPSNFAALSVFKCMLTALEFQNSPGGLSGKTVAIKGLGKTGAELARLCREAGAKVYGADIDRGIVEKISKSAGLQQVDPKEIHKLDVDIYAPCALGDEFTGETAEQVKAKIVCGTANNQLQNEKTADILLERGIVYVPDYVANAGGLINVADELEPGGYDKARVLRRIDELSFTLKQILEQSKARHISTQQIADRIAENFILEKAITV